MTKHRMHPRYFLNDVNSFAPFRNRHFASTSGTAKATARGQAGPGPTGLGPLSGQRFQSAARFDMARILLDKNIVDTRQ